MGAAKKLSSVDAEVVSEVCALIEKLTGVQLGAKQYDMAESRLRRRINDLGLGDFTEYRAWLRAHHAEESEALVSLLTTHHTYFFREFAQFELLAEHLPKLAASVRARGGDKLEVWSAACSRGQEVYSLAMHLDRHWAKAGGGMGYQIYGSDVDPESVKIASNGVYHREEIKEAPLAYLGEHWARGSGDISDFVKARKSLREHCAFGVANLINIGNAVNRKFDVIFCRNVFIYFTPEQIKVITRELLSRLNPGGLLAIGLSESLHGYGLPVRNIGPSVYGRTEDAAVKEAPAPKAGPARALRVVCIDDSPTVLSLLKKILTAENGYEVVGTAANGDDGAREVARLKPDLVTLDIHMPVCDGISYLKKHHGPGSPPVVMVTSVSRDDASLAQEALRLGASDYVEKPALNNLRERGEELRSKLKSAHGAGGAKTKPTSLDKEFAVNVAIKSAAGKVRVFSFAEADLLRALPLLRDVSQGKVPVLVALDAPANRIDSLRAQLSRECGVAIGAAGVGQVSLGTPAEVQSKLQAGSWRQVSALCVGTPPTLLRAMPAGTQLQVLVEDGAGPVPPSAHADAGPLTSFLYLSDRFLGGEGKK